MRDVIVEVRGGLVVEIYCDHPDTRIVIVDWDGIEEGEKANAGFEWEPSNLACMPEDTKAEFHKIMNDSRVDDCILATVSKR